MTQNNNLPWIVAIGALLIVAFLVYQGASPGDSLRDTITVSGTADLKVTPDKADLYITVEGSGSTAADAQSLLESRSKRVIDSLVNAGVSKDDIETTGFNVYPDYTYNPSTGESTIKGYKAQHSIHVVIKDLEQVGEIASISGTAGGLVNYVQFGLTDEAKKGYDTQALQQATADAKQKAISLTSTAGAKLGKVVSIQESNYGYPPFPYYDKMAISEASMGGSKSVEILPGDVSVTATVSVTYALN